MGEWEKRSCLPLSHSPASPTLPFSYPNPPSAATPVRCSDTFRCTLLPCNALPTPTASSPTLSIRLVGLPVRAHVSTRHGGVSPEPWRSLNFSVLRGDTPERVRENRQRLAAALGLDAAGFVHCRQVHGTGIAKVDRDNAGQVMDGSDGLITDTPGLPLSLVFADCVPLLIYDPGPPCAGRLPCRLARHGQRRGRPPRSGPCRPRTTPTRRRCRSCIGPSIGPQSYEVGPEVAALAAPLPARRHCYA